MALFQLLRRRRKFWRFQYLYFTIYHDTTEPCQVLS
jgi:hypothetical protein